MNNMQFVKTSKGVDIRLGGGYLSANGTPIATYPIGTIVENVDPDFSPAKEYGGTWERFGQGKVLVGFDENDADFNEVLKTGGEKMHTLSVAEMPSHNHSLLSSGGGGSISTWGAAVSKSGNAWDMYAIEAKGGSAAHNNLQPYVVVYRWRRVA